MSSATVHIETPDYEAIKDAFAEELRAASEGNESSFSFIKHHLPEKPILAEGIVQGIVIGGTNYILSTEEIQANGSRRILTRHTGILPIFTTKQILCDFFKNNLDQRADAIGINFGFPLRPTLGTSGTLDAELISGTKEHLFAGLHEPIGQLVASLFKERYHKNVPVSIANDTICLILAEKGKHDGSVIVGTGFNMALRHTIANGDVLVNLEAGNFNKFTTFNTLKQIDDQSEKPNEMLFEKSISGKYIFEHFNLLLEEFGLTTPPVRTGLELTAIAEMHTDESIMGLSRQIIARSARLVASAVAGVYIFLGQPKFLQLIGDGSLLWNGWNYQTTIKNQLVEFGIPENAITIEHITDSSINGAIGLITNS